MDQGQFQIPFQERESDSQIIQEIESSFAVQTVQSMEHLISSYEVVKDIEQKLQHYRTNATEAALPKQSAVVRARFAVMTVFVTNSAPRSLHDRLIEAESYIGVEHLKDEPGIVRRRFWYQEGENGREGDWFYEVHDTVGPMVSRYQFINGETHKLVGGQQVYFADGEIDSLHDMIQNYHDQVSVRLYTEQSDFDRAA